MSSTDIYYVYHLVDPNTNQPFYVGMGKGNRAYQHLQPYILAENANPIKCNKIRKLIAEGTPPTISIIIDKLSKTKAEEIEVKEISLYGRKVDGSGILTNVRSGGKAGGGRPCRNVSQFDKFGTFIQTFKSATLAAVSVSNNPAATCTQLMECCNKVRRTAFGFIWKWSDDTSPLVFPKNYKRVFQFDLTGNLLHTFVSAEQAANSVGANPTVIRSACAPSGSHAHNFTWSYIDCVSQDKLERAKAARRGFCPVIQLTREGVFVASFSSATKAADALGLKYHLIIDCCDGRSQQYAGHIWQHQTASNARLPRA